MKNHLRKKRVLGLLLLLFLVIPGVSLAQPVPDKVADIEQVKAFPTTFTISNSILADAWGRAQGFIALYSAMKLHIVTDYVIQTNDPPENAFSFGYTVVRTTLGDSSRVTVECFSRGLTAGADMNARILAYYIDAGLLPNLKFIKRQDAALNCHKHAVRPGDGKCDHRSC